MTAHEFQVSGMSCGHCEQAVAEEVAQIPGVTSATADAAAGTLSVDATHELDRAEVANAVDEAGYELV